MERADVIVATMTRVRDPEEETLVAGALEHLVSLRLPVVVCDRASTPSFRERIRQLPAVSWVEPTGDGLVGQVSASIRAALKTPARYILYTEPDKLQFFQHSLIAFLDAVTMAENMGVVLAARTPNAFETFPRFQRLTETAANQLCRELVGTATDYFYGPFLMTRDVARYVDNVETAVGWGWRPFVFAAAQRGGRSVGAVEGDYVCPLTQREDTDEDKQHRLEQLAQNARGLRAALALVRLPVEQP